MEKDLLNEIKKIDRNSETFLDDKNTSKQSATLSHTIVNLEELKSLSQDDLEEDLNPELEKGFPIKNWDRFEFRKLLGIGGMGVVYQAWDTKLSRMVALKFLRNSYGQSAKRFLQEARAQCRIEHPNVCKVYEAGEVDNVPYIAMQYIEGTTLRFAHKEMSLEQKVQVMQDTALAIHAAHRLGIIHRDIKPDNIMLAKNDEGKSHPIVMDFGLAKEVGNKGLTQTGALIGTPAYMSPEQARGQIELLDRRTDVYSLGAMFYSIIAGKAPFQGSSAMEVVLKVITADAESISQLVPSIPKDLNTIIMKCLEKDPKQRYESAQAFAQDLERYLNGETISIKAVSWYLILWKKALKHKTLVLLMSIALVIIFVLSGLSLWTWFETSRKLELERQMVEQVGKIESMMRFASLTPAHDIRVDRQIAEAELEIIKKQMQESGRLAEGPGNYALGRSYLAFFEYEKAREHLEKAYKSGFRTPNLELAMGQMLGEFYRRELDSLPQSDDKEALETKTKKLDKEYLEPIKTHLTAYLNARSKKSAQEVAYLEGLLALYKKDYKVALDKANSAMGQSSWYYEAYLLKGEAYLLWAEEQAIGSNYKEANDLIDQSEKAFQEAIKIGPSNLQARLGESRKWMSSLYVSIYSGKASNEAFEQTLLATDKLLELDPNNEQALTIKIRVYTRLADVTVRDGKDPNPLLQKAIYWAEKVLANNPKEVEIYRTLGTVYRVLGKYALEHGEDPHKLYDLAISYLQKAVALKPKYNTAYSTMGLIYQAKGKYEEDNGRDPQSFYEQAIKSFKKDIEISPNSAKTFTNLGRLYKEQGEYEQKSGQNPRHFYEKASTTYEKAIELNPKDPYAYTNLSLLCQTWAIYEIEKGKDPQAFFDQAAKALQKAIEINPTYIFAYNSLGILYQIKGEYELGQGKDPSFSLEEAKENFKKVFKIRPEHGIAHHTLGLVYQTIAKYEIEGGQDPNNSFEQAKASFEKAIEINPKSVDSYEKLGLVFYSKLEYELNLGREGESKKLFDTALSNYKKALEINPKQIDASLYIAMLFAKRAQMLLNKGQNPTLDLAESRSSIEKAITLKPSEYAYSKLASVEVIAAKWAKIQKMSPEEFLTKAKEALEKAIELNPNNVKGYFELAQIALLEFEWDLNNEQNLEKLLSEALEKVEKSLAANPANKEFFAIKGAILISKAKISSNQTLKQQGRETLEKALELNQSLKYDYGKFLSK